MHHKFEKRIISGVYKGYPWVPSLMKQNFNRTQKNKVIALKKIKKTFEGRYKGGPLGALSHEAKFQQDEIYEVFYSVRTQYMAWVV